MSREQLEAWWEINYHNGNPPRFGWASWRDGDGYKIDDDKSELDGMWQAWQAATSALEAKFAALAAENAAMKSALKFAEPWIPSSDEELNHRIETATQTPATDAFIADQRAHGVEQLANAWYAIANETDPGVSISDSLRLNYRQRADGAAHFANEIRQEAAQ